MKNKIEVLQAMADALQAEIDKAGTAAPQSLLDRKQALDEEILATQAEIDRGQLSDKLKLGKDPKNWPGL